MPQVLIALGANVGDGSAQIARAAERISAVVRDFRLSPLYRTAPMYLTDQPAFVNAAGVGFTELGPRALLALLKETESELGRKQRERNGPREIDLDVIAYGSLIYSYVQDGDLWLQIPHPRAKERRFVLQPLADLAPDFVLPRVGRVLDLLEQTNDQAASVERL